MSTMIPAVLVGLGILAWWLVYYNQMRLPGSAQFTILAPMSALWLLLIYLNRKADARYIRLVALTDDGRCHLVVMNKDVEELNVYIPLKEVRFHFQRSYSRSFVNYTLHVYQQDKLLFSQSESCGWNKSNMQRVAQHFSSS